MDKEQIPYDVVICADTIQEKDGKIIEKCGSSKEVVESLQRFSATTHLVHTAVLVYMRDPLPSPTPTLSKANLDNQKVEKEITGESQECEDHVRQGQKPTLGRHEPSPSPKS